ncbi:hypothetical protein TKK_0007118 [Trichogramma kaykai]|uniref:Uncharacterized protein n=1 Tax=Trichogramma kaykai TaxID=54128 RepID=A0ABD2XA33_9HYME
MVTASGCYTRITGSQLSRFIDDTVILIGEIKNVGANGKAVEIETTDKMSVNVNLPEPLTGYEGYLEVYGKPVTKSTLTVHKYNYFPPEFSANFESDKYNQFLSTLLVLGDSKWKIDDN